MRKAVLLAFLVSLFTAGCPQSGEDVPFQPPGPDKWPSSPTANITRVVLYVDTAKPLEEIRAELDAAGRYSIKPESARNPTEVAYFDYIVVSGGEMKFGSVTPYLAVTPGFLKLIKEYNTLLSPLRARGIKILLGVTGGEDGIAPGCLPRDETIKNQGSIPQESFAQFVSGVTAYYRLDGVEFWDEKGKSQNRAWNPYPEEGDLFFNGEDFIEAVDRNGHPRDDVYYWKKGGGFMIDMMAFVLEMFGAQGTHAGDLPFDQKVRTPILVRESGYGRWIPDAVPRYEFASSMAVISYLVHPETDEFGWEGSGHPNPEMEGNIMRNYGPVIIDLANITPAKLEEYSKKLGWGKDANGNPDPNKKGNPDYLLVYYQNLGPGSTDLDKLCVTSREVFGAEVRYE